MYQDGVKNYDQDVDVVDDTFNDDNDHDDGDDYYDNDYDSDALDITNRQT